MKRYYTVTVLLEVDDEDSWGSSCDETFHGPGKLHDPDNGVYVTEYVEITKTQFQEDRYKLFDEYGGI